MARYEDASWQASMRLKFDFNYMMQEYVGENGVSRDDIRALSEKIASCARSMEENRVHMKWRELPYQQEALVKRIETAAGFIRRGYENFVVLGIGGSALGPIAVQQALNHPHYNLLPEDKRGGPRLYVEDNIDPERMQSLLDVIDVENTMFNVVSKSGGTSETMSQLLIITKLLHDKLGNDISAHVIATTDALKGNLIKIARMEKLDTYVIPFGVGGRFSELCPVGLLPAAVCGIDIRGLLAGAKYMDECVKSSDVWENPAYMFAALQYLSIQNGCNISVLMPYADSLKYMSDWYAQLWAESLGKRVDRDGNMIHAGQTPVKALGVTDQHSQVQLYTEGPFDKVITFLGVEKFRTVTEIPAGYPTIPDVAFLSGHTHNELILAEQRATEYAVMKSGHLSNTITLPEVNAFTVGELIYFFEVATSFAGELLGIDAFNQPGVEEGKNATYALLGKNGFDEKKAELDAAKAKTAEFII